jgi:hypothetical protein
MRQDYAAAMSVVRSMLIRGRILYWTRYVRDGGTSVDGLDDMDDVTKQICGEVCAGYVKMDDENYRNVDRFTPNADEMRVFCSAVILNQFPVDVSGVRITAAGVCLFEDLYYSRYGKIYFDKHTLRRFITKY